MRTPLDIRLLDGATGTSMQARGMPADTCPEKWILEHPEHLKELQGAYADAGSDAVYAPTFGANRAVLSRYGLGERVGDFNRELVALSLSATGGRCKVGGSISPTGLLLPPLGDSSMDELFAVYSEQIKALIAAGVDFLAIETMISLGEARAALLAAKELCNLPVFVTVTVDANGRTLSGSSALCCLAVLESMGADAFGINCAEPAAIVPIVEELARHARIPVIAKPNAGLPDIRDGRAVFDMTPADFAEHARSLARAGASIVGGCCGTTPEHISAAREALEGVVADTSPEEGDFIIAATEREAMFIDSTVDISDPIEITEDLAEDILLAESEGFRAVKIFFDEPQKMETFAQNSFMLKLPLCIDAADRSLFERAVMLYNGRALYDPKSETAFPDIEDIIGRYGIIVL